MTAAPLLFYPGRTLATPGALAALQETGADPAALLRRHCAGDWGEVSPEDARENDFSLGRELRLLSRYTLPDGTAVWVITEADRSATTILLPDEY